MALTIKGIEAAKPKMDKASGKAKPVRFADGDGLFLEVTETSKRWRARYFFEGKEQMLSLGKFPVVGLKEAREKNFLLRQQLDRGINPALERKKEKSQIKEAVQEEKRIAKGEAHPLSLEAVALDWLEDIRKTWKKSTYEGERQRVLRNIIGPLGRMRINEVKPADVRAVFQQLEAEGKYDTLRKIAENTVRIFNFGIAVGKCENNPAYSIWKGLSFKRPDPNRGFATITSPDKVGKLLLAIETTMTAKSGLEVATALRMAPYVFLRPGSLAWGEWAEIDWQEKEWRIPGFKMKNNKPHIVPLARQVLALLENLRKYTGEGQYLFPSYGKEGHLTTNALLKAIHAGGYRSGEFTAHGFRHMAVTLLKELGFPHDVIYLQLSHTLERDAAKAAYDKAQLLPQRKEMMQSYADYLDGLREKAKQKAQL